jgi:hypothetical protein
VARSFDRIAGYFAAEPVRVTAFLRQPLIGPGTQVTATSPEDD